MLHPMHEKGQFAVVPIKGQDSGPSVQFDNGGQSNGDPSTSFQMHNPLETNNEASEPLGPQHAAGNHPGSEWRMEMIMEDRNVTDSLPASGVEGVPAHTARTEWHPAPERAQSVSIQEGERCCKSNNRSWRCSKARHPGSRYCINHIRDYVDGRLVPRKALSAHEKLRSTDAEADAPELSSRRGRGGRKSVSQHTGETHSASAGGGVGTAQTTDSEGLEGNELDRQGGYLSRSEGDEETSLPPPLLPQQHLPMKKRFAVTPVGLPNEKPEFGEGRGGPLSEKDSGERALDAKRATPTGQMEPTSQRPVKTESASDVRFAEAAAGHAPVGVTLGELPDAFLRAQVRASKNSDDAGARDPSFRPESSMSPKGESLKRVGMIVQALAGGLDNFGYPEEAAEVGHAQGDFKQAEGQNGAKLAAEADAKEEADGGKGEFKRCIMSGGTGWKCGRPRIDDSKYCQYHFELRRKQRQNSGARAAKGVAKRKPPAPRRGGRGGKSTRPAAPRGRKRKLPSVEPEREAFPFLSVEFRLHKRTRTKKAVRPHAAVDRLLLAAKVRREDSLELLSEYQAGRQRLQCLQVEVSDSADADLSEMDEDEAKAHEALTQMLAASTHQGPSGSDHHRKEDTGPEKSTGACGELCKRETTEEAAATKGSPPPPSPPQSPIACHALKRLVAAEGAGESDGAEPNRPRAEVHAARRLAWELQAAEENRARLEAEAAQAARELKQEAAARAELEGRLAELARAGGDPPSVALREEVAALRRELGQEKATSGALRKQIRQLKEQLEAQETQFLGHQADLEVLEAKHKELEAGVEALLSEKHALEEKVFLVTKSSKCLLCHTVPANIAIDPCGCRLCSSCTMLPAKDLTKMTLDPRDVFGALCPACGGNVKGAVKVQRHAGPVDAVGPSLGWCK